MDPRKSPLRTRDAPSYELDWEAVEQPPAARSGPRDVLGLTPEDRRALGMTAPRTVDLAPNMAGDASEALREAMSRGASYGKRNARSK